MACSTPTNSTYRVKRITLMTPLNAFRGNRKLILEKRPNFTGKSNLLVPFLLFLVFALDLLHQAAERMGIAFKAVYEFRKLGKRLFKRVDDLLPDLKHAMLIDQINSETSQITRKIETCVV